MLTPATNMSRSARERGSVMLATIGIVILAGFVIVAIMVSTQTSNEAARERVDVAAEDQVARDAGVLLASALSAQVSGEHNGYVPNQQVLRDHASAIAGGVVATSSLGYQLNRIDAPRVPATSRYAIWRPLADGRRAWWQVYSVKPPTWGTTRGGRVAVYVRTWTSATNSTKPITQPSIHRVELRPTWFADFQLLVDGPMAFGPGAVISGRIHSNGFSASYYDQYRAQVDSGVMLRFQGGATCTSTASLTTARGGTAGPGACTSRSTSAPDTRFNLLRARDSANRLRAICQGEPHPSIQMACPNNGTNRIRITLSGNSVHVPGVGSLNARVAGDMPGLNQGAVVIASGDVEVTGTLGSNARALIVTAAMPNSPTFGTGSAPSIWIVGSNVGSSGSASSSFGAVAEGDIILDQQRACGVTIRGALLAMSGGVTHHPTWRVPYDVPGPANRRCGGRATINGSVATHFGPNLITASGQAGYANRSYVWLDSLYHNPPPMYPTAADWEVTSLSLANLDCFTNASGGALQPAREEQCA